VAGAPQSVYPGFQALLANTILAEAVV